MKDIRGWRGKVEYSRRRSSGFMIMDAVILGSIAFNVRLEVPHCRKLSSWVL